MNYKSLISIGTAITLSLLTSNYVHAHSVLEIKHDKAKFMGNAFSVASASGYVDGEKAKDNILVVNLGGQDDVKVTNISGAWKFEVETSVSGRMVLTFNYQLSTSSEYEKGEYSHVLVTVDNMGVGGTIDQLVGNGNGGPEESTGWQVATVKLGHLEKGKHKILIGGLINQKSWNNETTSLMIGKISIGKQDDKFSAENPYPKLSTDATDQVIADHLDWHEVNSEITTELSKNIPEMSRERGYDIQRVRLEQRQEVDPIAGWKIGFSLKSDPSVVLDTVFAPVASSFVYPNGTMLNSDLFVNNMGGAEPEVLFWLNADLKKTEDTPFTRAQVSKAVGWVGTGIEFGASRLRSHGENGKSTRSHSVADNISHAGVILPKEHHSLEDINWDTVIGSVNIDGTIRATGPSSAVLGKDPLQGLVWLANEMYKYGYHLKAGQFVISGSVVLPVQTKAGEKVKINFSGLGDTTVSFAPKS